VSYLEYNVKSVPTGLSKLLHINWPVVILLSAIASVGFLMLYSVAGGSMTPWAEPQMKRFAMGLFLMFCIAMVPIWFLRNMAGLAYGISVLLLLAVEFFGSVGLPYDKRPLRLRLAAVLGAAGGVVVAVFESRGTAWQLLKDYQYRRIDTFIDPASDPLGAGYHITQSKIALGSGGWTGRGYMQGTQSRLNFLPEKHTDFIFTTLAEEFGFVGGISLLGLYVLLLAFCVVSAIGNKDRFASLLTLGIGLTFFLFFAVNMSMVMGLAPVVGVPLPMVSYGGSAMLVLLLAFGLVQSAHVHRPR